MTQVINARGTFTPLGVSRSSMKVSQSVAYALTQFYEMNQLQSHASQVLADFSGAEAGALSHCTASAITVSIAGLMTQGNQEYIEQLPNTQGMRNQVIILEDHVVNYGHSILQSIRLSGAKPLIVKGFEEYESALDGGGICGVLLVSSKLAQSQIYNFIL